MGDPANELRDQLSIETPELVALEFPVAGVGSRSMACVIDYAIQGTAFVLMLFGFVLLVRSGSQGSTHPGAKPAQSAVIWGFAIIGLIFFLLQWGYFSLFEAFWNGQTPAKRVLKLRVIQQNGQQIGFFHALSRNLLRVVDGIPGFYFVGIIFLFATKRAQRLGDLVAGTIVVHEREVDTPLWNGTGARSFTAAWAEPLEAAPALPPSGLPADLIARLSREDLEMIESFNGRRLDLPYETSSNLAAKLAAQVAAKMHAKVAPGMSPETFLEVIASEIRLTGSPL